MPAKSPAQQRFFGMIYKAKKTGDYSGLSGKAKKTAKNISKKDAKDFATTEKEEYTPEDISNTITDDINFNNGLIV